MAKKVIITAVITAIIFGAAGFLFINKIAASPAEAAMIDNGGNCEDECIEYSYFVGHDGRLTVRCTHYACPTAN